MGVQYRSANPNDTLKLGVCLGEILTPGMVVGLEGSLGAGKTWMVKGIVQGVGHYDVTLVKSPAYNLVHEYHLENPSCSVFHMDFYRLEQLSLGDQFLFEEILEQPHTICLIEWGEKFLNNLVSSYLSVRISKPGPPQHREICVDVSGSSKKYRALLQQLQDHAHPLS